MDVVNTTSSVVETTTSDRPSSTADEARFRPLIDAARRVVACDAAALLRLDGEVLTPVAVEGLSAEALGRRFSVSAHPRLARLLASPGPLRFAPDGPDAALPDPYDGLIAGQPAILAVHDCMGAPLRVEGRLWGLLTFDALRAGAFDAIDPQPLAGLLQLVESGIASIEALRRMEQRAGQEHLLAQAWRAARAVPRELIGNSPAMNRLRQDIDTVAPSDLTVLVLGETGVGKDLVAQRLHARSRRHDQPLVQVNCAALPETLADSELFGHKKGAFTGAQHDRTGKFELADGGTLFLDEVGELPLSIQAKLLRVLQSGEIQRPGSDRARRVDVRIVAATNRDLREAIAQGRFRADLYHRLAVYPLVVPPLRERAKDVITLAGSFLEESQHRLGARNLRLTPAAKSALLSHTWPGNVRELEHVLSRAALRAFAEQGRSVRWVAIEPRHLALEEVAAEPEGRPETPDDGTALARRSAATRAADAPHPGAQTLREATEAFQRQWIEASLARHGGRMSRAAEEAGMDRSNFHRLARRLGVAGCAGTSGDA
ncbi:nitric oxide reductase transcriptional regulator NorR [Ideonella sp. DXS29W]|uniref:Nitric oxide reductase transcriptional regulator NorR n=1 Tax=Ideonella lacteola TaxID=2984193 RepID=A0ABU9BGX8_9BURK